MCHSDRPAKVRQVLLQTEKETALLKGYLLWMVKYINIRSREAVFEMCPNDMVNRKYSFKCEYYNFLERA